MKPKIKPADQYLKIVEWSDEDQCYIGSCPGLMIDGVHGNDKAKVFKQLCQAAEEVVELFKKDQKPLPPVTAGKNYSGKILIRISPQLHQLLALKRIAQRNPRRLRRGKLANRDIFPCLSKIPPTCRGSFKSLHSGESLNHIIQRQLEKAAR